MIIITMTTFYMYAKTSASYFNYKIETIAGDDKELDNVVLNTTYQDNMVRSIQISKDGAKEWSTNSFLGLSDNRSTYTMFSKYIKQYRQYMRGKELNPNVYYEDDERLIYANAITGREFDFQTTWQVDILNKNTNNRVSFELAQQQNQSGIHVQDVCVRNGKIQIFTYVFNYSGEEELHIYTVDEAEKKVVHDELIEKVVQRQDDVESNLYVLNDSNPLQGEEEYIYGIEKVNLYNGEAQSSVKELYIYNAVTHQRKTVDVPSKIREYVFSATIHDHDIIVVAPTKTALEVWRYNMNDEKWNTSVQVNNKEINKEVLHTQINNGKLYVMNRAADRLMIFVSHLQTGKLLYEGEITGENMKNIFPTSFEFLNESLQ